MTTRKITYAGKALAFLLLSALGLSSCSRQGEKGLEAGVSRELATMRKERVADLHYDLKISVPSDLSLPVGGECVLSFSLTEAVNLPLDYAAQADGSTIMVEVNGHECETTLLSEHIVLPRRHLRRGHNVVKMTFVSSDNALNRHEDYLYSLFVPANARSVFPCFDQPDLKATFSLEMSVPDGWKTMQSSASKPIPTYLFSFVAGKFFSKSEQRDGREMTALYRETDPGKVAQLAEVFDMAELSIRWMEDYTGVPYPFDRYDFVVLPGYQFGGMEHPGAIQFNDRRIFLPENATPSEHLSRFDLIAHETAHMWFGDLVTMRWFDDVWTKEVFAGFFSDKISREQFPDINHDLNHIVSHFPAAFATDRTAGTHPIQQELENLNSAGLLYGNIIYHKAPIMMRKIEQQMGEESLRRALQVYLSSFAYGNATWDELIAIMAQTAPDAGIMDFDRKWVKTAGIPLPSGKEKLEDMPYTVIPSDSLPSLSYVLENYFKPGAVNELRRMMFAINYYELMQQRCHNLDTNEAFGTFSALLSQEDNPLIANQLVKYLLSVYRQSPLDVQESMEEAIFAISQAHPLQSVRLQTKRSLFSAATNASILNRIEEIWARQSDKQLSTRDYTAISYHLAVMNPDRWKEILALQRGRLTSEDEVREFDYVSRACNPDPQARQTLFESLIQPENRVNEPWALSALALLCDKTREPEACRYIAPALDSLQFIQQTSDIFFPGNFLSALLSARCSDQAREIFSSWIARHPDYPPALMRKIKENGYLIFLGA